MPDGGSNKEWILILLKENFRQDLQDYHDLNFIFLSFQMKLRKINPTNGGKDQFLFL